MKAYKIEMMTKADAAEYFNGGYNYKVKTTIVTAETAERAVEKAKILNPGMVVNTYTRETEIPEGYTEQMTLTDLL